MPSLLGRSAAALFAIALLATGCIAEPTPDLAPSARPGTSIGIATAGPTGSPAPAPSATDASPDPVLAKLDDASRELLGVIEPGELVQATIQTVDPVDLVAQAQRRHGRGEVLAPDAAFILAERDAIVALLRDPGVNGANLEEVFDADRLIASERPVVVIPTPGSPYAGRPLPDGPGLAELPDERRAPLLAALGNAIVTIDGQPYREMALSAVCQPDPEMCWVSATGRIGATGDVFDGWTVESHANRGWLPILNRSGSQLGAIPRPLARAAEWIARMDRPTAKQIASYTSIASIRWEPLAPGVIDIVYQAQCTLARLVGPPGTKVAEDGVCIDALRVRVDVATGRVLETAEVPDS